ncbi:MAG TPA: serine hydrolase domain-containing protein [Negativicutes bacterium]|nr:serine hydrolase domain-containing protein [Negativicutes bacterium]
MLLLRKILCILSCLLICSLPMLTGATPDNSVDVTARTIARMEVWKAIQSGQAGSATVAIMDNGRIVYAEGFGMADRANSISVDRHTVFNIGSISKTYCATAIMLLVDEGKVNLDKPVTTYIPEFTMADERYREITVRMLLNHSSGLPGGSYANSFGYQYHNEFLAETLTTLSHSHLKHRPGERSVYCNDGFTLAEIIVERVSGQKYIQFLADRIFTPLSLQHTGLTVSQRPDAAKLVIARYYDSKARLAPPEALSFLGSGGLSATAENLCRFADTFSQAGKQILSDASRTEMWKNQPPDFWDKLRKPMISFGLGWDLTELPDYKAQGLTILGKSGGTHQYASMLYLLPEHRISVAVIGTGPTAPAQDIALHILNAYASEKGLLKREQQKVSIPVTAQLLPAVLAEYAGYYAGDGGTIVKAALDTVTNTLTIHKTEDPQGTPMLSLIYNSDFFHDSIGKKYYFTTVDHKQYFIASGILDVILFEKIEPLSTPVQLVIDVTKNLWLRRNAKAYESNMSAGQHLEKAQRIAQLDGYIDFGGLKKIISPTFAGVSLASMRDASELELFEKNGRLWAWVSGLLFMPSDLAPALENDAAKIIIGGEGYNEWRKTTPASILDFNCPKNGRVIIFDPVGTILYDNVLDSGRVFAPAGSFIEFAGDAGDTFTLSLTPVTE